jgi:hypothetical protein
MFFGRDGEEVRMRYRVILPLLLILLLAPQLARAQGDQWQSLDQVKSGRQVDVIDRHLKRYSGKFVGFSDTNLTLLVNDQEIRIARDEVYRVTAAGQNRKRNILLGLAIGAGAGLGLGAALMEREGGYGGAVAGTGVGFAGIGAGIGALVPSHKTVYRAEAVKEASSKSGSD